MSERNKIDDKKVRGDLITFVEEKDNLETAIEELVEKIELLRKEQIKR